MHQLGNSSTLVESKNPSKMGQHFFSECSNPPSPIEYHTAIVGDSKKPQHLRVVVPFLDSYQ